MKNFVGKPASSFAGQVCLTSFVLLFFSFVFATEAFAAFTEVEPDLIVELIDLYLADVPQQHEMF